MADREPPYDPYIPSGGQGGSAGNQRTAALQAVGIPLRKGIIMSNTPLCLFWLGSV